jgi:hypothetical protein
MGNRKILLIIAGGLIVVGVAICFIVGIGESFKCDCAKKDECKNINKPVEENDVYEATVIDMGLDLAHSVTFDYNVIESLDTNLGALDLAIAGKYLLIFDVYLKTTPAKSPHKMPFNKTVTNVPNG